MLRSLTLGSTAIAAAQAGSNVPREACLFASIAPDGKVSTQNTTACFLHHCCTTSLQLVLVDVQHQAVHPSVQVLWCVAHVQISAAVRHLYTALSHAAMAIVNISMMLCCTVDHVLGCASGQVDEEGHQAGG